LPNSDPDPLPPAGAGSLRADAQTEVARTAALDLFWRPGCPFCYRLIDAMERDGIEFQLHNIWEDEAARRFVAEANRGNETVPTVVFDGQVLTNPEPSILLELLRDARRSAESS
jgi:mycoredoxin